MGRCHRVQLRSQGEDEMTGFAPTTLPDFQLGKRFRCGTAAGAKEFLDSDEVKRRLDAGQKMILRLLQCGRERVWVFEFAEPSKPRRVGNGPPVIIPRLTARQKKMSPEDLAAEQYLEEQITHASIVWAKERQQQNLGTVEVGRRAGTGERG
jgi:hypothetical protein